MKHMLPRVLAVVVIVAVVAGCAHRRAPSPTQSHVDQRLLPPDRVSAGSARIEPYVPRPHELFRMPEPLSAPLPALAEGNARSELAPTTVCARVAIAADGSVMWVRALDDRSECVAGRDPANADLLAAVTATLAGWRYRPAAFCRYAADAGPRDGDPGDCADAQSIEQVPVTLEYAFVFEIRHGQAAVRTGDIAR